jgi:MATE family multidrug resistance protein
VVVRWLNGGVYGAWTVLTAYTVVLGVAFLLRFLGGKWKTMKVIEEPKVP